MACLFWLARKKICWHRNDQFSELINQLHRKRGEECWIGPVKLGWKGPWDNSHPQNMHTPSKQDQLWSCIRFLSILSRCHLRVLKARDSPQTCLCPVQYLTCPHYEKKKFLNLVQVSVAATSDLFLMCMLLYTLIFTSTLKSLQYKSWPILLEWNGVTVAHHLKVQ